MSPVVQLKLWTVAKPGHCYLAWQLAILLYKLVLSKTSLLVSLYIVATNTHVSYYLYMNTFLGTLFSALFWREPIQTSNHGHLVVSMDIGQPVPGEDACKLFIWLWALFSDLNNVVWCLWWPGLCRTLAGRPRSPWTRSPRQSWSSGLHTCSSRMELW